MAEDNLNYREIGKRIRRYRRTKDLSQDNLAELTNLSQVHIGHIETGAVKMSLSTLVCIANALDVSPDILLSGEAYHATEVLQDEFAKLLEGCNAQTLRLMYEVCETIKADNIRRKRRSSTDQNPIISFHMRSLIFIAPIDAGRHAGWERGKNQTGYNNDGTFSTYANIELQKWQRPADAAFLCHNPVGDGYQGRRSRAACGFCP